MVYILKFRAILSFCSQIKCRFISYLDVRIANREDPDQTASSSQSDQGLHSLSRSL